MSNKAKYIQEKERTLYNDLEKSYKKLKEITNWYSLSLYNLKFDDIKNHRLYMLKINNIYHEMKNLLIDSKDLQSLKEYDRLISYKRIESLEELEDEILCTTNHIKDISSDEYNLSFNEAIDVCLNENAFIIGEDFKKGHYAKNNNGVIVLMTVNNGFSYEIASNLMITRGLMRQKFKALIGISLLDKALGIENK